MVYIWIYEKYCLKKQKTKQKTTQQQQTTIGRKENVLFNDALNTYYLQLYDIRHMVKDHSDSERGNPLLPHRLLFD